MIKFPIYFDYAATTPVDPRVVDKMVPYLTEHFGNPASTHSLGQYAKKAVDEARSQVADLIQADVTEIIWTSGATESNNLALKGAAVLYQRKGKHIVTLKTEHPSILETCQQLEKDGFTVTYLSPEKNGLLDLEKFQKALRSDTFLVSVMHVNNETGVIQPISAIADITASHGILLHVDAVQSVGKLPIDVKAIPIDLMSFTAHKIYGPKGIGALYVRRKPRVRVAPQMLGGGQEQGMRSGTLATHQMVGMGEAFALAKNERIKEQNQLSQLSDYFLKKISAIQTIFLNHDSDYSLPSIINMGILGVKSEDLIASMPTCAISAGSACQSKGIEPSYVLRAMGIPEQEAKSAVRISFGRWTTKEEIDYLLQHWGGKKAT